MLYCTIYWLFSLPCLIFSSSVLELPGVTFQINCQHPSPCLGETRLREHLSAWWSPSLCSCSLLHSRPFLITGLRMWAPKVSREGILGKPLRKDCLLEVKDSHRALTLGISKGHTSHHIPSCLWMQLWCHWLVLQTLGTASTLAMPHHSHANGAMLGGKKKGAFFALWVEYKREVSNLYSGSLPNPC